MPQAQVQAALDSPDSTVLQLLKAHEEICVQYGYLIATSKYGIRISAESELIETFSLMCRIKLRIHREITLKTKNG